MAATFTITNLDRVMYSINPASLQALQRTAMTKIVLIVEGHVKEVTPVKTGNLKRSITGKVTKPTEALVGSNVIYAPFVHRRNPYLTRGADNAQAEVGSVFTKTLKTFGDM